ncbi:hypothetical protein Q8W71_32150 [Methylobacterium sp. NEAU 140]|uniref:hypothetical protein n=1 Tax=Methylobacterium sp. NEAU 140 TaxID=3064945 RepID=UPI0027375188|nr:hypothetical protein [Methylobacterium sp. NEAU 140]MDP4027227.1 hypothetical protein [Methylobacterium sp. NEAU 140]
MAEIVIVRVNSSPNHRPPPSREASIGWVGEAHGDVRVHFDRLGHVEPVAGCEEERLSTLIFQIGIDGRVDLVVRERRLKG